MNRQLRRANEKSEKRREREKEKQKEARRSARVYKAAAKAPPPNRTDTKGDAKEDKAQGRPAPGTRRPRLTGAYLLLVIGVIASQAFLPQETDTFSLVVQGLFYLILGYFLSLWLLRRGVARAFLMTVAGGILLAAGVEAVKLLGPGQGGEPNPLFISLSVPGLLLGAWLGRFVYRRPG